jgi:thiamine-phosphate pyrophosphorylase
VSERPQSGWAARLRGLHVLADDGGRRHDPPRVAAAACEGGASVVQLRAKSAPDRQTLAWAAEIRACTRRHGVLFVVNDRFDLALVAGADGVHLGQEDLPPDRIPKALRERLLIGRSTHSLEEVRAAGDEPVDYVAFGPLFATRSKVSAHGPRGLEMLARAVALAAPRPLVAIGGIDAASAARVAACGAGLAVLSAVGDADDPVRAVRELVRAAAAAAP